MKVITVFFPSKDFLITNLFVVNLLFCIIIYLLVINLFTFILSIHCRDYIVTILYIVKVIIIENVIVIIVK